MVIKDIELFDSTCTVRLIDEKNNRMKLSEFMC